eukprot:TRINITY_DN6041_c0_g1_i11.p1 TRINITY_DN6041_c0_g1~~TRINITY_DN6041_c0_g1_i11.p1  ORF type:complete len:520 (+),score=126.42 TRINITY_DN6041_c0_g1_i11:408-1967(+)
MTKIRAALDYAGSCQAFTCKGNPMYNEVQRLLVFRKNVALLLEEIDSYSHEKQIGKLERALRKAANLGLDYEIRSNRKVLVELKKQKECDDNLKFAIQSRDPDKILKAIEAASESVKSVDERWTKKANEALGLAIERKKLLDAIESKNVELLQEAIEAAKDIVELKDTLQIAYKKLESLQLQQEMHEGIKSAIKGKDADALQEFLNAAIRFEVPAYVQEAADGLMSMKEVELSCHLISNPNVVQVFVVPFGLPFNTFIDSVRTRFKLRRNGFILRYEDVLENLNQISSDNDFIQALKVASLKDFRLDVVCDPLNRPRQKGKRKVRGRPPGLDVNNAVNGTKLPLKLPNIPSPTSSKVIPMKRVAISKKASDSDKSPTIAPRKATTERQTKSNLLPNSSPTKQSPRRGEIKFPHEKTHRHMLVDELVSADQPILDLHQDFHNKPMEARAMDPASLPDVEEKQSEGNEESETPMQLSPAVMFSEEIVSVKLTLSEDPDFRPPQVTRSPHRGNERQKVKKKS